MSTTEPPAGSTPPPGEPTPPPPAAGTPPPPPPAPEAAPMNPGTYPPPPPPVGAAAPGGAPAVYGAGAPGSLLDRFLARLIDFIIVGIVGAIIGVVLGAISDSWLLANLIDAIVTTVLYLGYFGYLESNRGQTIGKQVMKLRVQGPTGANPTMNEAIKRNIWLGAAILGVVPILGQLLGGLIELAAIILIAVNINSDPQRQHWFDKFAGGTKVVKIG